MSDLAIQAIRLTDILTSKSFRPLLPDNEVNGVNFTVPNDQLKSSAGVDQYQFGFDDGQRIAQESFEIERAHYNQLIASAAALQSEASDELAALISISVERLVREIVGNAPVDAEWLNRKAAAAAAMVSECDMARTLWLHPDDIGLIDEAALGLTLMANQDAERGSISIECSQGWIEHGRALYLDRLSEILVGKEQIL